MKLTGLLILLCASALPHGAANPQFRQNLGAHLPLHAIFADAAGQKRALNDYFGHTPVVLVFGYYHCPRLCSTLMDGVLQSLQTTGLPYAVVGIGIDPRETPQDATRKLAAYRKAEPNATGLHLLTGTADQIALLARAAGFQFAYDKGSDQYTHPAGFLIATPDGSISRYFSGLRFDQQALRLALIEASNERVGSLAEQVTLLCSHYDPLTGRYTVTVMTLLRAFGILSIILLLAGIGLTHRRARKRTAARHAKEPS